MFLDWFTIFFLLFAQISLDKSCSFFLFPLLSLSFGALIVIWRNFEWNFPTVILFASSNRRHPNRFWFPPNLPSPIPFAFIEFVSKGTGWQPFSCGTFRPCFFLRLNFLLENTRRTAFFHNFLLQLDLVGQFFIKFSIFTLSVLYSIEALLCWILTLVQLN